MGSTEYKQTTQTDKPNPPMTDNLERLLCFDLTPRNSTFVPLSLSPPPFLQRTEYASCLITAVSDRSYQSDHRSISQPPNPPCSLFPSRVILHRCYIPAEHIMLLDLLASGFLVANGPVRDPGCKSGPRHVAWALFFFFFAFRSPPPSRSRNRSKSIKEGMSLIVSNLVQSYPATQHILNRIPSNLG